MSQETRKCSLCGSTHIWKAGMMPLVKLRMKKQRFKCADCGKTFY